MMNSFFFGITHLHFLEIYQHCPNQHPPNERHHTANIAKSKDQSSSTANSAPLAARSQFRKDPFK